MPQNGKLGKMWWTAGGIWPQRSGGRAKAELVRNVLNLERG